MSDIEHEVVVENRALRVELERVRALAREALTRAAAELDRATGRHDPWLDTALSAVDPAESPAPSRR
jgi:hypothetical protein